MFADQRKIPGVCLAVGETQCKRVVIPTVFNEQIPDRLFEKFILAFAHPRGQYSDGPCQFRIQGCVIYFSLSLFHLQYPQLKRSVGDIIGKKKQQEGYDGNDEFNHIFTYSGSSKLGKTERAAGYQLHRD